MFNNNNNNDKIEDLLRTVSSRLGKDPQDLKNAVQSGNFQNIFANLDSADAQKIEQMLSDKNAASKLLSSEQAQQMIKNLLGEK